MARTRPLACNIMMGRERMYRMKGVVSTFHQVTRCVASDGNGFIDI